MQKYKINHRIGSFYATQTSPVILAKNGIQALAKAMDYAKIKFDDQRENTDFRLVIIGHPNYDYDKQPIYNKYCIGVCKFKENYLEIEPIK